MLLNYIYFLTTKILTLFLFFRVERFEIIKCSLEPRSYRGVKLANNLQALIIYDPTTTKAAVSLTVGAGKLKLQRMYDYKSRYSHTYMKFIASSSFVQGTLSNVKELSNVADFLESQSGIKATSPPPRITEDTQIYSFEIDQSGIFFYVALDE